MKKISILSVMTLLAACGGGSGGGHSGGPGYTIDVIRAGTTGTISEAAAESNNVVTGMVSEIGVAADGSTINIGRAPFTYNGKEYNSYNLTDVDFFIADEGFMGKMRFDVDENGEITAFRVLADEDDEEDEDRVFSRVSPDSKDFEGNVRLESEVPATLTYNSMGKDLGLKYSDFGGVNISVVEGWRPVFIGGYDVKKIEKQDITTNATFNGKVTGSVVSIRDGEGSGRAIPLDADATLTFNKNTKTSELVAKFNNWYDMRYTENNEGKSVDLSNYTNSDADFRMLNDTGHGIVMDNRIQHEYDFGHKIPIDEHSTIESLHADAHDEEIELINSDLRYFGDNNVPYESVGMIQIRDCDGNRCGEVITNIDRERPEDQIDTRRNDEVRVNLGFGAKR